MQKNYIDAPTDIAIGAVKQSAQQKRYLGLSLGKSTR
jgi:hypothetical protein